MASDHYLEMSFAKARSLREEEDAANKNKGQQESIRLTLALVALTDY